jgi:hypothetical protein
VALQNHALALRAHFIQASNKGGNKDSAGAFDQFATKLSNAHAQSASGNGFCAMELKIEK